MPISTIFALLLVLGLFFYALADLLPAPTATQVAKIIAVVCFAVDVILALIGLAG